VHLELLSENSSSILLLIFLSYHYDKGKYTAYKLMIWRQRNTIDQLHTLKIK
jgi:hypothetical protein